MVLLFVFILVLLVVSGFDCGILLDGSLDRCGLKCLELCVCLDFISVLFLAMLFFCGCLSLCFSSHYLGGYMPGYALSWSMLSFLFVMGALSLTGNYIMSLILWEYLGIVSFLLILYYGNPSSLRATFITLFASRFGDVSFFVLLLWGVFWFCDMSLLIICFFLCLIILSKSACFPFISWLLEAMRAPTPVSSLVHSSTLVAAGIWFFFRYADFFGLSSQLSGLLFFSCLISIFVSSFCSLVFMDLKKIVALSTCNNISWCLVFFLLGDVCLGLVQLLGHGVCKCFLFISLGDHMSCSGGGQDSRGMFSSGYAGSWGVCAQGVLVLCLCGIPFLGIFFSKHFFLGMITANFSFSCLFFLFFCFFLSYAYSFRLLGMLWGLSGFGSFGVSCSFLLVFFCSLFGSVCNYFMSSGLYESGVVGSITSLAFLFLQLGGSIFGCLLYYYNVFPVWFSSWGVVVWGCEWVVSFFYWLFSRFLVVPLFVNYCWELRFFSFGYNIFSLYSGGGALFSLKFLVLSVVFLCCLSFLFWCWFSVI